MHIHVPKPIHGWRQFFNEVFVIVVGICIALFGEQLVETWREHRQARESLHAIEDELEVNLGRMHARVETADCIDHRLGEIAAYIESPNPTKRPSWVGRPQLWTMQTSAVDAARAYGSLTVLDRDLQMAISTIYGQTGNFADLEKDEQWAWAELRSITEDRDLTDSDKASLRQAIQRARFTAWALRTNAVQALDEAKSLHVVPTRIGKGSQSVCIPMNTPFDVALKQSGATGEPR